VGANGLFDPDSFIGGGGGMDAVKKTFGNNSGKITNTISGIGGNTDGILGSVGDYAMGALGGMAESYFKNSEYGGMLDSLWNSEYNIAASTMSACYEKTSGSSGGGSFCSFFKNFNLGANPCDVLPNSFGNYKKKSKEDIFKLNAPLNDWCKKIKGEGDKQVKEWTEASKTTTPAGKAVAELEGNDFRSDASKAGDDTKKNINNMINNVSDTDGAAHKEESIGAVAQSFQNDKDAYKAQVVFEALEDNQGKPLNKNDSHKEITSPYESIKDYKKVVDYQANLSSKVYKGFSHATYILKAEIDFAKAEKDYISVNDFNGLEQYKSDYIVSIIGDGSAGKGSYREELYLWAEENALNEIKYELPDKLQGYSVDYSLSKVNSNDTIESGKEKIVALHQLYKQQHYEASIMTKWRKLADDKADELEVKLKKLAIATKPFNRQAAMEEINSLLQ
jgi:hypothetical protein